MTDRLTNIQQLVARFTEVKVVGLDLGSAAVKVVELGRSEGRVTLRRAAVKEASPPLDLKRFLSAAGITAERVALGLASPEVITKPFQFPPMPRKELNRAIQLEAEQTVLNGHALSDVVIDWHTLPCQATESIRGLLAVVPKAIMADQVRIVKEAGLMPAVVDVAGLALWNAYWVLLGKEEPLAKTVLLINVGARSSTLVIAKGPDELMLVRDFELGAQALRGGHPNDWLSEVTDSLAYARSKAGLRTLDAAYVTGGASSLEITLQLKQILQVPVTIWNPFDQITREPFSASLDHSLGPLLTVAIGLALRQPG